MERSLEDTEISGLIFACSCGNTEFEQECFVKSCEIINIVDNNSVIKIVSKNMKDILEDDIEYNNNFKCPTCGTEYEVINKDGKSVVVKLTVGEDNAN